mgnify:CR=1 FL=1
MGYVIQGSVLFPHLTVKQNIAYVLQLEKKTKNMDQNRRSMVRNSTIRFKL